MPLFAVIYRYPPDTKHIRLKAREKHAAYLGRFAAQNRIVLGGPFLDDAGALTVLDAADEAEAREFARNDPYDTEERHIAVEIHPFLKGLPK